MSRVTLGSVLAGLAFALSGLLAGGFLGLVAVRLFVPRGGTGWDDLGNALGGLFLGGLLGFVAAAFLIPMLTTRRQVQASVAFVVIAGGSLLLLLALRPARTPITGAEPSAPTVPTQPADRTPKAPNRDPRP